MTMESVPKLFVLCCTLYFSVFEFVEGVNTGLGDKETAFRHIMEANENRGLRRDGIKPFQGDIIITPEIRSELRRTSLNPWGKNTRAKKTKRQKRAAISNKARRWMGPDGQPLIPFIMEPNNFPDHTKHTIRMAIEHWVKHVPCLRFVKRTNQRSYLSFFSGKGCWSDVGRMGGRQRVSIGPGCGLLTTIIHEIGHALGFWHEQSRPDRDRYVKIYWNNIKPEFKYAFKKYNDGRINSLGVPYDYDSIMHYHATTFGQGRTTITRINGDKRLTNKRGLSSSDIKQAKLLYCRSGRTRNTRPPRPAKECRYRDSSWMCRYWSKRGYCSRYTRMSRTCKKTCLCKKRNAVCQDKNRSCGYWSRKGYCITNKYMRSNCKKSCRLCT